jgi:hypothetical protein
LLHLSALLLAVNEILLAVSARLLAIGALGHRVEILRHRLDRSSELGQLLSDTGNVFSGRHGCGILRGKVAQARSGEDVAVATEVAA